MYGCKQMMTMIASLVLMKCHKADDTFEKQCHFCPLRQNISCFFFHLFLLTMASPITSTFTMRKREFCFCMASFSHPNAIEKSSPPTCLTQALEQDGWEFTTVRPEQRASSLLSTCLWCCVVLLCCVECHRIFGDYALHATVSTTATRKDIFLS